MHKFFDVVPGWLYALVIAALIALSGWAHMGKLAAQRDRADLSAEYEAFKRQSAELTAKAQAEARATEQTMQRQAEEIARNAHTREQTLRSNAAAGQRVVDRLRDEITRLNANSESSAMPSCPGAAAITGEARTARELLGSCTQRYRDLAEEADRLRDQVRGLLEYQSLTNTRE